MAAVASTSVGDGLGVEHVEGLQGGFRVSGFPKT